VWHTNAFSTRMMLRTRTRHCVGHRPQPGWSFGPPPTRSNIRHRSDSLLQRSDGIVVTHGNHAREHTDASSGYWVGCVRATTTLTRSVSSPTTCVFLRVMSANQILTLLEAERDRLTKAIEVRKGAKSTKANTKTDRRPMFPQARKRASERMKRLLGEEEEDCRRSPK